jgi:VCBS repeat-containing protein
VKKIIASIFISILLITSIFSAAMVIDLTKINNALAATDDDISSKLDDNNKNNDSLTKSQKSSEDLNHDTIPADTEDASINEDIKQSEYGTAGKKIYQDNDQKTELIERRTLFSKTFKNIDGSYEKRIGVGPIHYFDENRNLDDIDTNFEISDDSGFDYEVVRGFYKVKLKAFMDSTDLVEYHLDDSYFLVELQDLYWSGENGEKELISLPQHVSAIVNGNRIVYPNAYGDGIDVEFIYHPQYFGKNLVINSLPAQYYISNFSFLQFDFKMSLSADLEVFIDDQKLEDQVVFTQGRVEFRDKKSNEVLFFFNEPYSEDSQDDRNMISFSLEKNGSEVFISKMINSNWLEHAVYPVKADADTIYLEGDTYDMYDGSKSGNVDSSSLVQVTKIQGDFQNAYWAFLITGDIINGTINSVTFTGYVTQNDMDVFPIMYGLQQEDCPALEGTEDPGGYTRTTNNYTWSALQGGGTGVKTTGNIDTIFNEWISDYSHNTPPDRFGLVLDENDCSNNRDVFFYDYSHASYSDNTYLTIDYTPDNYPPVAVNDSYSVDEETLLSVTSPGVLVNDLDNDSDPLSTVLDVGPTYSSSFILNSDGSFNYTHDGSETTSDSFTYHANDGTSDSNIATVTITINPINDPPVANDDSYRIHLCIQLHIKLRWII